MNIDNTPKPDNSPKGNPNKDKNQEIKKQKQQSDL
jgi:hypothetical protein